MRVREPATDRVRAGAKDNRTRHAGTNANRPLEVSMSTDVGSAVSEELSYFARARISDPDGNRWVLQEIATRLPGRVWEV